jgi:putative transposase
VSCLNDLSARPNTISIATADPRCTIPTYGEHLHPNLRPDRFRRRARASVIPKVHKQELHKYITGIVTERKQKVLAIHCMPDHTHLLIGLKPTIALSDLVRDVKNASTNFINGKRWVIGRFGWQEGFGAFSYGHSQLDVIIRYIQNQERHHARTTFRDEYLKFLKRFEIQHDQKFIFKQI